MYNEMYNEINILTMSDEEIKNSTLTIADKFGVKVRCLFVSKNDDGHLIAVLDSCDKDISVQFKSFLWRYMSGIVDINGNVIGTGEIYAPAVTTKVVRSEKHYNDLYKQCSDIGGYYNLL